MFVKENPDRKKKKKKKRKERKFHSLIPLKRSCMRYLFIGYPVNGMKTLYINIKTVERVKKQTVLKKDGRFQGKITQKL